ncbi:unnamed protein product [Calicophoron daubneyi]|uniref:Rhodanese domain-containing protein n=1 Tax=Calicophoron daubneyi TaxID=300641 RepID=A0AAV2TFY5_CALDB
MVNFEFIKPSQLYNTINQFLHYAFVNNPCYTILFDARIKEEYDEAHIVLARRLKRDDYGDFVLPYGSELECKWNIVVYDGNTETLKDKGDAVRAAKLLFNNGSRRSVKILEGGYELFSRLYPFLRSQKIMYLPKELENFMCYPLEIIPNFLYIGSRVQAIDRKMHRELNITAHVNCDVKEDPVYSDPQCAHYCRLSVNRYKFCDNGHSLVQWSETESPDLSIFMHEASDFIQQRRFEARRVLIISTHTISRSVTIAIAYLIKYEAMTLKDAWKHLRNVCIPMRPSWKLMMQLAQFEANCRGLDTTKPLTEEEFYGKRLRGPLEPGSSTFALV